ncbi:hypothetical protein VBG40_12440 [Vagococcus fluvialis]|uniref:hypothetical protein n=1 Tax=Vagococcus fluvialis TaxID=2738 RepID=UPI00378E27AA
MKILYTSTIPLSINSSANMRNVGLLKGLTELGYEIYTLTPKHSETDIAYDKTLVKDLNITNEIFFDKSLLYSNLTTKKSNHIKKFIKSFLNKIYQSLSIYDSRKKLIRISKENFENKYFDYIISSSDPKSAHLVVKEIKLNKYVLYGEWIQYWGDPFASDINKVSIVPNILISNQERKILNLADKIVYTSPFTLKDQMKKYPLSANKMIYTPTAISQKIIFNDQNKNDFYVGYYGDYYSKDRNINPLVKSQKKNKFKLEIVGRTDIKLQNFEELIVRDRVQQKELIKLMNKISLLICVCNKHGNQIPGKIYQYAATNKPILIILDGELKQDMRQYFDSFDRFYTCENNEKSISETIDFIKKENREFIPLELLEPKMVAKKVLEN